MKTPMILSILFIFSVALANVGFEVEFDLLAADGSEWNNLGKRFRQKPLGVGKGGFFELQLDDVFEFFSAEIVFPPTRMYKGFPTDEMFVDTFCHAFHELSEFLNRLQASLYESFESRRTNLLAFSTPAMCPLPGSDVSLPFDNYGSGLLLGTLQMTVSLPVEEFFPFILGTLTLDGSFVLHKGHSRWSEALLEALPELAFSDTFKTLLFFLLDIYGGGVIIPNDKPISYLKMLCSIMSRTNLASIFKEITEEDRIKLLSLSEEFSDDTDKQLANNLAQMLRSILLSCDPAAYQGRNLDNLINTQFFFGDDNAVHDPILLSDYCLKLVQGTDMFADIDDGMSKLPYLPSKEIVFEVRTIQKQPDARSISSTILDLYVYAASFGFDIDRTNRMFISGNGQDLCRKTLPLEITDRILSFNYETELLWTGAGADSSLYGPMDQFNSLGLGPAGFWELYLPEENLFSIAIPPVSLYPNGIHIPERDYEIMNSLKTLFDNAQKWDSTIAGSDSTEVSLHIPGLFSFQDVSLEFAKGNSQSGPTALRGKLIVALTETHENMYSLIEQILESELVWKFLDPHSKLYLQFIKGLQLNELSKLYILEVLLSIDQTNLRKFWTSQSHLPSLFQSIPTSDLQYLQSLKSSNSLSPNEHALQGVSTLINKQFPNLKVSIESLQRLFKMTLHLVPRSSYELSFHCDTAEDMVKVVVNIQQICTNTLPRNNQAAFLSKRLLDSEEALVLRTNSRESSREKFILNHKFEH